MLIRIFRQTLKLQDMKKQLALLLITHLTTCMSVFWPIFCARINALYAKEMYSDRSDRCGQDYVAIHYHWYNRYAEQVCRPFCLGSDLQGESTLQGRGAPLGVHPDFLRKANVTRTNHTQRTPHESMDIASDTEEFAILTGIMEDLMSFIQANVGV